VQLKDGRGSRDDYRGAELGAGEIDLHHALSCLQDVGYKGVFCAEYGGPEAKKGIGYLKCYQWMNTDQYMALAASKTLES